MLSPEIIPSLTKIHDLTVLFFVDDMNLWRYILSVIFFYKCIPDANSKTEICNGFDCCQYENALKLLRNST